MQTSTVLDQPAVPEAAGVLNPAVECQLTAVVELPFEQLEQATAALRGHLRHKLTGQLTAPVEQPMQVMDWDTLIVDGPALETDPGGRTWFIYTGTASSRLLRPIDPAGPGHDPST